MHEKDWDQTLRAGRGAPLSDSASIAAAVSALVRDTRREQQRPKARWALRSLHLLWALPLGALAVTGGATTVHMLANPDVVIPIEYTTDTGKALSCTIYIQGGSVLEPGTSMIADALEGRDWEGIGQKIYARAVQISDELASASGAVGPQPALDQWAWFSAESDLTIYSIPGIDDFPEGEHAAGNSDCTGQLH